MTPDLADVAALLAVARAGGFRQAARLGGVSASGLSEAVRRLEARLGVRLLNRTTRSLAPTQAGARLLERLRPALAEMEAALEAAAGSGDTPAGVLRLNVPISAARLVLPAIVPGFLAAHPGVRLEVVAEDAFVDVLGAGCDAGIRYGERLELDMVALPIGPREQRIACAASPAYLARAGRPQSPAALLGHACIRARFSDGRAIPWTFMHDGEGVTLDPPGPLMVTVGGAIELAVEAAMAGVGLIQLFEAWLAPHFASGALEPVLEPWWESFDGPFLYYPAGRLTPPPLRAFVEYLRAGGRPAA